MKSIKTALLGLFSVAALSSMAQAQTHIYFTGSTAFRAATVNAIKSLFDSGSLTYAYTGSTETKQNAGVYSGTISSVATIIKTYWSGSEAGVQTVAADGVGQSLNFPNDTPDKSGSATALSPSGLSGIDDPTSGAIAHPDSAVPQVDMCDTYQATSVFRPGNSQTYTDTSVHTFPSLSSTIVGVVPFEFVVSKSGTATMSTVTDAQVRNLFGNGVLPVSFFSGNHADEGIRVYATGRDPDSGTRLSALVDTGYGAAKAVKQYQPLDANGALVVATGKTIATIQLWPSSIVNSLAIATNNGGYNSGGKLAGALGSDDTTMVNAVDSHVGGCLLTYLSTGDAGTAAGGGAKILAYNGQTYSSTAVAEGAYTFWSYEHLNFLSGLDAGVKAVANSVAYAIANTYAANSGIALGTMQVGRSGSNKDGQPITASFSF